MSVMFPADGAPIHLVHEAAPSQLTVIDWTDVPRELIDTKLQEWLAVEKKTPFDWSRPPHVRFGVHLLGKEMFQLTIADASLDGWAVATLATELLLDYARLLSGTEEPLRPLTTRYAEFAALEQAVLRDERARAFWKDQIGAGASCSLPRRRDGGRHRTCQRQRSKVQLGGGLLGKLRACSQQLQVPMRSILLASHVSVLHEISQARRVITGLVLNGRPESRDGDRIIGSFNNIVPYKIDMGAWTWSQLVCEVFEHEKTLVPFRRYPYAQLQRDNGKKPLFDSVFVFTDFYIYDVLAGLEDVRVLDMDASDHTYFPLTVHCNLASRRSVINLAVDYSVDEFSPGQVQAHLERQISILEAV